MYNSALLFFNTTQGQETFQAELLAATALATGEGVSVPTEVDLVRINNFISTLKEKDVWDDIKTLNIYGVGSLDFNTINLANPAIYRQTKIGTPVYTYNKGVKTTSTASAINTKFKVNEYAGIETNLTTVVFVSDNYYDLSNRLYGSYVQAGSTTIRHQMNALSTGGASGTFFAYNNNALSMLNRNNRGMYVAVQTLNQGVFYKDGGKQTVATTTVTPNLSNEILLLTSNRSTTSGGVQTDTAFFPSNVQLYMTLNSISDAQEVIIRTAWNDYLVAGATNTTYYVRPTGQVYGTGDGLSYANAFSGNAGINWLGMNVWDTLYICDTHTELIEIKGSYLNVRGDYAGHPCFIDGSVNTLNTGMNSYSKAYLNIHNIKIANCLVEGMTFWQNSTNINVYDCEVWNIQNQAYQNENNSQVNYYRCIGRNCVDDGISLHGNAVVYAQDCQFYENGQGVNGIDNTTFVGVNCTLRNNTVQNIKPDTAANFTIKDSLIENGNVVGNSTIPLKVQNCTLINSPVSGNVQIT